MVYMMYIRYRTTLDTTGICMALLELNSDGVGYA